MCDHHATVSRRDTLKHLLIASSAVLMTRPATAAPEHRRFMDEAQRLKESAIARGDPGYGAVVERGDTVVGRGASAVVSSETRQPTLRWSPFETPVDS